MTFKKAISIIHALKECRMAKYMDLCPGDCMECEYQTYTLDLADACNIAIDAMQTAMKEKESENVHD